MEAREGPPLACVSGGPSDGLVVWEAARIARALGHGMVVLLHVVDTGLLPGAPDSLEGRAALQALRLRAVEALEAAAALAGRLGVEALPVAREGSPCREIAGLAESARPPVVVVGYSDRGRELGSTAACVLARYRGTVLVAKPGGHVKPRRGEGG